MTLAPASQVVKGPDPTKLKYKLTNIEFEYEMIRSGELANEATGAYTESKEFLYNHVSRYINHPIDKTRPLINIKVNSRRRSMKGIFVEPYNAGTRESEKFIFPDLNKVSVTINGSPNVLYNNGIESKDAWRQVSRFFMKEKLKPQHMTLQKFCAPWPAKKCMAAAPASSTPQTASSWKSRETPKDQELFTSTSS